MPYDTLTADGKGTAVARLTTIDADPAPSPAVDVAALKETWGRSSSTIVTVVLLGLETVAPSALEIPTVNVSSGSSTASPAMDTEIDCVLPLAAPVGNVTLPGVCVKSAPAAALPAVAAYDTVTGQPSAAPLGVVRRTFTDVVPVPSLALTALATMATDGWTVVALAAPIG